MPTVDEIRTEWKGIRSALGNLICYVDGATAKIESLKDLQTSWQKGYDCGHQDGYKAGVDSVATDSRALVKTRWAEIHVDFSGDADLQIVSMLCGNCHRWHNEVYHYGNPIEFANYCQFCGADMKQEADDEIY